MSILLQDNTVAATVAFQVTTGMAGQLRAATANELEAICNLARELRLYSRNFRIVSYRTGAAHPVQSHNWRDGIRYVPHDMVTIIGNDEGCVNRGTILATCWIEAGSFVWEA